MWAAPIPAGRRATNHRTLNACDEPPNPKSVRRTTEPRTRATNCRTLNVTVRQTTEPLLCYVGEVDEDKFVAVFATLLAILEAKLEACHMRCFLHACPLGDAMFAVGSR